MGSVSIIVWGSIDSFGKREAEAADAPSETHAAVGRRLAGVGWFGTEATIAS